MGPYLSDPERLECSGRLVTRRVDDLHPHPSFLRHRLCVPVRQLSATIKAGQAVFQQPLEITQNNTIMSGYAQWESARLQGQATVFCLEYQLSEREALEWLLRRHRRSNGLSAFSRTLLALDLEPWLHEKARLNQQVGGQAKGLSKLAEAERLDVRSEIATAAGVSTGNVAKVKQLLLSAHADVLEALRADEISIHRAWLWCKESPEQQREALTQRTGIACVKKAIRHLISRQSRNYQKPALDFQSLARCLKAVNLGPTDAITVTVIDTPGKAIFLTQELFHVLSTSQQELRVCDTNNR